VKARGGGGAGITILEIVPEGTNVQPGDILAKLDSSALENERTQQQIVCNNSEAAVTKARNDYETALIAKREYIEGKYLQEVQMIESAIAVAEEELRRAKEYYVYSKRLERKGYVTKLQLEADQFAQQKAQNDLNAANTELRVLREFTRQKQIKQLESDITTAEARLKSEEASHKLDLEQLALIESQVGKCVIRAKTPGQVVYANMTNRRGGQEIIIEEGTQVRERQIIIRLPDPKRMQVTTNVNEAKVSLVEKGQPATILLDAFSDVELRGVVTRVNEYPAPAGWFNSNIKEYETVIRILDAPAGESAPDLKPGLTAQVKILVERLEDRLLVPVQAVLEHGGEHYCVLHDKGHWKARKVEVGSTNDTVVVIHRGLAPGEKVVLHANAYRDKLDLPEPRKNNSIESEARGRRLPSPTEAPSVVNRRQESPPTASTMVDGILKRLDRNGDGRLQEDEWSEQMKTRAKAIDANGDGVIDRAELTAALGRMAGRGRPGAPGGKP
jgi:multidrug resistance efflux pump